ncbi:MAG: DNA cytosine methyltransferase [Candidatus Hydrogenedentes bacterium]|nr:DNA cytosine methyltransferase [Candidatus Hydrogenedentota bacterium]
MLSQVVSLFCGCGGLDLGFTQAGFNVALALDVDPVAVRTYNHNHGGEVAQVADLLTTDGADIIRLLDAKYPNVPPKGVIGGSPCQVFSIGNRHIKDDDTRRILPTKYAAILKALNDRYELDFFVFENVRGITFEKHKKDFSQFKESFEDAGFRLFEGLLDAQHFGVAQKRPRVFVVGLNARKYSEQDFTFPAPSRGQVVSVADKIDGLPEPVFYRRDVRPEDLPHHRNHWTMQPKSAKFSDGFLKEGQCKGRSFRVLSWAKPSWTVAYGNREVHIHPLGTRRLSVYESMLLQGFPSTYQLLGTLSAQYRQVSDAVPPPVGKVLAEAIGLICNPIV